MKRYAVYGLMEYLALIPAAGRTIEVHFTGGQLSGYGIRPAIFTTADPVLQHLIEHSHDFLSGKIRML